MSNMVWDPKVQSSGGSFITHFPVTMWDREDLEAGKAIKRESSIT